MERRARDPQELDDLFRVDHLATRMRRHAESLIILSGEAPARGWRNPVPLVDVLRAAVAEVEDYTRIKVSASTQASLAGPAVGDVIHMIAELAENATIYSPPQTPVSITGSVVGQGFAVEIEDRGLGMTPAHREEINAQLENPPAFDLSGSDQLGLFVAGQLAKRQNIRISLRASPYGGTTAIVLIPRSLVVPEGAAPRTPAPSGRERRAAAGQARHQQRAGADRRRRRAARPGHSRAAAAQPAPSAHPRRGFGSPLGVGAGHRLVRAQPAQPVGHGQPGRGHRSPAAGIPGIEFTAGQPSRPAGFALLHPGGGNGPSSVIPATAEETAGTDLLDESGLPRRVRQASLAPQLRESPARPAPSADLGILPEPASDWSPSEAAAPERTPEETRATMSAIQRGWQRGRSVFDPADGNGESGADATDAMEAVGTAGASGETAVTGITDSGASHTDGDGASAETHRPED